MTMQSPTVGSPPTAIGQIGSQTSDHKYQRQLVFLSVGPPLLDGLFRCCF